VTALTEMALLSELKAQRELLERNHTLVQGLVDDHETRIKAVERAVTKKQAVITTAISGVVSVAIAVIAALGCRLPAAELVQLDFTSADAKAATVYIAARPLIEETDPMMLLFGYGSGWSGTGWYASPNLIVTAGHVCEVNYAHTARTAEEPAKSATIIWEDDVTDVCVLAVNEPSAVWLRLAPESSRELGDLDDPSDNVWYFGYPSRVPAMETGEVTGWRDETSYADSVRILASLQAWGGASGSAVLRQDGRVVGVLVEIWANNGQVSAFTPVEDIYTALENARWALEMDVTYGP